MSIYLISNRKVTDGRFSNTGRERARREFRVATCTIPDGSDKADYNILEDKDHPGYDDVVAALNKDGLAPKELPGSSFMFYELYQQMVNDVDEQCDTLFFIHGFANKLEDNLEHIAKLHKHYVQPQTGIKHLVYVAWPSIGKKFMTYWNDQNDAEETGRMLGGLFTKLYSFFMNIFEMHGYERCLNKIHLMTHSMGNTVLQFMLKSISEQKMFPLFGEALLLNADCPDDVFEPGQPMRELIKISERRHIYISRSDDVLGKISRHTKNMRARLGHKGPVKRQNLDSETFVMDTTNAGRADTFRERSLDHWGYIERKKVIEDIIHVLSGMDEDDIPGRSKWEEERQYFLLKK